MALYDNDIWNGLSFYIRNDNYIERYCFASNKADWKIRSLYLNNLGLLKRYLVFFRENIQSVVNYFDNNFLGIFTDGVDISERYSEIENVATNILDEELDSPKYGICNTVGGIYFTPRERECLYYVAMGFLLKEIADKLEISISTVEYYLNNIKTKTKCNTRSELLNLVNSHQCFY